ncbi:hypothetical protein VTK73DRAFT_9786 [Phialemonium thermophilum]|uniref:Uncharacterized protein n=1 Tax=Phialemonium thermophilum TaxID=223376 RepID=A0ABR3W0C1_9PEZI
MGHCSDEHTRTVRCCWVRPWMQTSEVLSELGSAWSWTGYYSPFFLFSLLFCPQLFPWLSFLFSSVFICHLTGILSDSLQCSSVPRPCNGSAAKDYDALIHALQDARPSGPTRFDYFRKGATPRASCQLVKERRSSLRTGVVVMMCLLQSVK